MQPHEIAPGLILVYKGTHNFDPVKSSGVIAEYHKVTSSVVLYLGKNPTVIDSGARVFEDEIRQRIEKYIDPRDVQYFIATHYHHDHIDNSILFRNALRILDYGMVTPSGIMTVYDDPGSIPAPEGVEIFATPGHVKNHISVKITIDGKRYVCAGDAVREDILTLKFRPDYVDSTYLESARKIYREADVIIPGHGDLITVEPGKLPSLLKEKE
jgi:glyoxylase-like metal-dependent hydrolase (beta-lactamase superfamily II)